MRPFKIGVIIDSFRLPLYDGLKAAKAVGADGLQVYAVRGDMSPDMPPDARRQFKDACAGLNLEIAALCGDLGGHGFQRADENKIKVPRSKQIVDLAVDVGTRVVTTHIGVVPEKKTNPVYRTLRKACREIARYAADHGVTFAIETGPEPAAHLRAFLDDLATPGIGVNLDPANLVMVCNDDPVEAARILGPYVVHTHAKDGVQHQPCDPVKVYGSFAGDKVEDLDCSKLFSEVPLGEGKVPWDRYLEALEKTGYRGYLTIEREVGQDPSGDIRKAVQFLRAKLA